MTDNKLTIFQLPTCGTCRSAVKKLRENGRVPAERHIVEATPTADELKQLISTSGLPLSKFFNVSGDAYRMLGLKEKLPAMSDDEKIALLASNGMLIKRPIVTDGSRTTVGFKEEAFGPVWHHE
jgi:arsenate reductase